MAKHSEESAAVDNTGDSVHVSHDEWWCPTDGRWVLCPGPCPDGSTHEPRRTIQTGAERIMGAGTKRGEP